MARRPPLPTPSALRRRREHRTQRLLANRAVADALVSAAGLVGRPVRDRTGAEVGRVLDVVVRWRGEPYPAGHRARGARRAPARVRPDRPRRRRSAPSA